jgi:Leu/Phe-tRNA-protein transferase
MIFKNTDARVQVRIDSYKRSPKKYTITREILRAYDNGSFRWDVIENIEFFAEKSRTIESKIRMKNISESMLEIMRITGFYACKIETIAVSCAPRDR